MSPLKLRFSQFSNLCKMQRADLFWQAIPSLVLLWRAKIDNNFFSHKEWKRAFFGIVSCGQTWFIKLSFLVQWGFRAQMIRLRRLQRQTRDRFMQIWATTSYSGHIRYIFSHWTIVVSLCYLIGTLVKCHKNVCWVSVTKLLTKY